MRKDWEHSHKKAMDEMGHWMERDALKGYQDYVSAVCTDDLDAVSSRLDCLEYRVMELEQGREMKLDSATCTYLIEQAVRDAVDKLRNDFVMDHLVD